MRATVNLICNPYENGKSGVSRYMQSVCKALLSCHNEGFDWNIKSSDESFKIQPKPLNGLNNKSLIQISHFLSERRIVPVSHPYIVTCHDIETQIKPYRYGYLRALYSKTYINFFLRKADAVVCPSKNVSSGLVDVVGVSPERVVVIRHGVELSSFYRDLDLSGIPNVINNPYLLIVSRLEHPGKNLLFAINAFSELRKSGVEMDLVIVGAPWMGHEVIKKAAMATGFSSSIHILGSVSDEKLRVLYSSAAFLFFPGLREGFALPVLESLSCGTPVLLSEIPVLQEFNEVGDGVVYYNAQSIEDCVSKMKLIISDTTIKSKINLDKNRWSWSRVAEDLVSLYRRFC